MLELKQQIVNLCVNSGLSIEAVTFVLKDLYRDAEDALLSYKAQKRKEESQNEQDSQGGT